MPTAPVYGSMEVTFFKPLGHRGQARAFVLSATWWGLLPAAGASAEQEPGFDESQVQQGWFSFSDPCCLSQAFRGAKNSSHRQSEQIILMRAQK